MKSVRRNRREAASTYDQLTRFYDLVAFPERGKLRQGLGLLAPKTGERILEIGFGTGSTLVEIADSIGGSGKAFGIDISSRMVSRAEKKIRSRGLEERTELVRGDAVSLPFPDSDYDGIFSGFTLELFAGADIPKVLGACRRVLKPEGRMVLVSLSRERINCAVKVYEWLHERFPKVLDCRPIELRSLMEDNGYVTTAHRLTSLFGLPVAIIRCELAS